MRIVTSSTLVAATVVSLAVLVGACGDDAPVEPDAAADPDARPVDAGNPDANPEAPATLAESGLYADPVAETLADGVQAFTPRWALWSDGATKRRWIYLPPDTTIDTTDMNFWRFPEGTKLWKEFSRGETRVETRLYQKIGPDDTDWFQVAFVWNEAQTEAVATPAGLDDALGTEHDVPSRSDCRKCHDRTPGRVLGFSALQLDYEASDAPTAQLDLADVVAAGMLSAPPTAPGADQPFFPLPEDLQGVNTAALGYLHSNCGGCHNPESDVHDVVALELRLDVARLTSWADTPSFVTTVDQPPQLDVPGANAIVRRGVPAESAVIVRMSSRPVPGIGMPPLGTELQDQEAIDAVSAWITSLASP